MLVTQLKAIESSDKLKCKLLCRRMKKGNTIQVKVMIRIVIADWLFINKIGLYDF